MRSIVAVTVPATDRNLTTLENAKLELGITDTDSDAKLNLWIAQGSAIAAKYCNRVLVKETITETFRHEHHHFLHHIQERRLSNGLHLTRYPIVTVASVTVDDKLIDASEYEFDETELYRLTAGGYPSSWHFGKSIVVVYDAGYTPDTEPSDLERAVTAMVRDFRAATLRDDPNLKSRETVGVSRLEWWVPEAGTLAIPIEISGLLDPYVRKWGWMT